MLRFVLKFQNQNWMTAWKTVNHCVTTLHYKMEILSVHQVLWNFGLSVEEHSRILLNGAMWWHIPCIWEMEARS